MSNFKFVSYQEFPEDQYTKELVYLCFDEKYRVAYVRKQDKNGGKFWSVPSVSVTKDGVKSYCEAFLQDSVFLDKDIKKYLDARSWEKKSSGYPQTTTLEMKTEDIPF